MAELDKAAVDIWSRVAVSQRLKPHQYRGHCGTAEAVPYKELKINPHGKFARIRLIGGSQL
jgi:hypothetical protein